MIEVSVDSTRCQGHARCFAHAPDLFEFDDEGYAFVPEDRRQMPEMTTGLRLAHANCPERAIVVTEE